MFSGWQISWQAAAERLDDELPLNVYNTALDLWMMSCRRTRLTAFARKWVVWCHQSCWDSAINDWTYVAAFGLKFSLSHVTYSFYFWIVRRPKPRKRHVWLGLTLDMAKGCRSWPRRWSKEGIESGQLQGPNPFQMTRRSKCPAPLSLPVKVTGNGVPGPGSRPCYNTCATFAPSEFRVVSDNFHCMKWGDLHRLYEKNRSLECLRPPCTPSYKWIYIGCP